MRSVSMAKKRLGGSTGARPCRASRGRSPRAPRGPRRECAAAASRSARPRRCAARPGRGTRRASTRRGSCPSAARRPPRARLRTASSGGLGRKSSSTSGWKGSSPAELPSLNIVCCWVSHELARGHVAQLASGLGGRERRASPGMTVAARVALSRVWTLCDAPLWAMARCEQPARGGRAEQRAHAHAAGGLAEDRDVRPDRRRRPRRCAGPTRGPPPDRELPALATAPSELRAQIREIEEAERSEAVVDRHQHDVAAAGQGRAVVDRLGARADHEAAAVDPHHDGPPLTVGRRRVDVQVEAVLVGAAHIHARQREQHRVLRRRWPRRRWRRARRSRARRARGARKRSAPTGGFA